MTYLKETKFNAARICFPAITKTISSHIYIQMLVAKNMQKLKSTALYKIVISVQSFTKTMSMFTQITVSRLTTTANNNNIYLFKYSLYLHRGPYFHFFKSHNFKESRSFWLISAFP